MERGGLWRFASPLFVKYLHRLLLFFSDPLGGNYEGFRRKAVALA